jgi:hypothetical protein
MTAMMAQRSGRSHWVEGACARGACEDKGARELGDAAAYLLFIPRADRMAAAAAAYDEAPVGTRALFTSHLPSNLATLTCFMR